MELFFCIVITFLAGGWIASRFELKEMEERLEEEKKKKKEELEKATKEIDKLKKRNSELELENYVNKFWNK